VASGGCSVLSLLTQPFVKHIDAFDINPTQVETSEKELKFREMAPSLFSILVSYIS
jgi:S-adenosylmethionine:diacylglycerol 3-amino-3-carboxypropyl transferase